MKKKLPLLVMEKLLKSGGAKRVSESAKAELQNILESKGQKISESAIAFSRHAGRKTVKRQDIRLATED